MPTFDYSTITQEPVVYYPRSGNPSAVLGLAMEFYIGGPGQPGRVRAMADCVQAYLTQAQGQFRSYAVANDRVMRRLKPGENIDPALIEAMVDPDAGYEIEAGWEDDKAHFWSLSSACNKVERQTYLGDLLITYPFSILDQIGLDGFIQQFVSMCNAMEVEHAYAGPSFIEPFNVGGMDAALEVIGSELFNYPCFNAYSLTMTKIQAGDGTKSIGFLTAVSNRILEKAGGAQAVLANAGQSTLSCPYSNGVIFQAGNIPQIGSPNFIPQEYINLGRALKPTRAEFDKSLFDDPAGIDDDAFTQRWLSRFDGV
ncbi:type VI immunity family protein [Sessilibacter corallicola]|uniref:DUF3396 domain-containing protein n=1 Tax=Sessilibacter corallicola TaxID=2904075 RepID=A0ABQ0AA36_9GAMM